MSKSTYEANRVANARYGGGTYTKADPVYIGLSTANPGVSGSGLAEPSGNNYSRVAVTNDATNFPNASGGAKSNAAVITFPTPSGDWGVCTHVAVFDASSGGNMLDFNALASPKTIESGDPVSIPIGDLDITEA